MSKNGRLTIQEKMLAILADGLPHSKEELHTCLSDDLGNVTNVRAHLVALRKILRPRGEDIICEYKYRKFRYRHVRLLASAYDGKR